jgi:zinc protease
MMHKVLGPLLLSFFLCLGFNGGAARAGDTPKPLTKDSRIIEGQLSNGMHYVIRPNSTPSNQVSIWLHIGTGSINETDEERGLAHFLEHMAFDGTDYFPPGAMNDKLREMGLTIGVHENAFTTFDQTTFQLNLPSATPQNINTALLCLSQIAYHMTIPQSQIEKEKKVVLEELRARSGPQQRTMKKTLSTLFTGDKLGQRDVIGTEQAIRSFTREEALDFYRRGYRPEKSTLLVVGDIDPATLEKLIPTYFADWQPAAQKEVAKDESISSSSSQHEQVITDPELATAQVTITSVTPPRPLKTEDDVRKLVVERLADWLLQNRLETMIKNGGAPFQNGAVDSSNFLEFCHLHDAILMGDPAKWRDMLKTLETECHRVELYGFSDQELAEAKSVVLAQIKQQAESQATRSSLQLVNELNENLSEKSVSISDAFLAQLVEKQLPTITSNEVTDEFKAAFDPQKRIAFVTLPSTVTPAPSDIAMRETVAEAYAEPVKPLAAYREIASILDQDPAPPTAPPTVEKEPKMEVTTTTLANQVVVNHRSMTATKNQVLIKVTLPGGEIEETAANRGITQLVAACLNQTATTRLSSVEMKRLLNGRNIEFYAEAEPDALTLNITTTPEDLEDAFRLLHAILTSAVLENSAAENWREMMVQQLDSEKSNVASNELWALRKELYSGDLRHQQVPIGNIHGLTLASAQDWANRLLREDPVEMGIVGDVSNQQATDLANRYLGSLPPRPVMKDDLAQNRQLSIHNGELSQWVETPTITDKAMVSIGYRGASIKSNEEVKALQIISYMVQNRLREKVREEKGLTYTASTLSQPGDAYPDAGLFFVYLTCDPKNVAEVTELCQQTIADFVKGGFTPQELTEATEQYLNSVKTMEYDPHYWLNRLSRLKYTSWNLDWMKNDPQEIAQVENKDFVRNVALKYLVPERRITVMSFPKKSASSPSGQISPDSLRPLT